MALFNMFLVYNVLHVHVLWLKYFPWISFIGQRSVFHTGSLHAYSTIASLYPQAKSGFFMMANGPWPVKFRTDLEPLSYVLSDILLQEEQWLNLSTVCSFPEPWEEKQIKNETVTEISTDELYDFTPYVGKYGHAIYGDIAISNDLANRNLSFRMNSIGEGNLTLVFSENSTFHMDFAGRLSLIFGQSCEAYFAEQSNGLFQKLHLKCAGEYDFHRGVSFLGEYGPTSSSTFMICDISPFILSMFILLLLVHLSWITPMKMYYFFCNGGRVR